MDAAALSHSPAGSYAELRATPATVCDLVLDAAISSGAEMIWFDPRLPGEDSYDITIERQGRVLATLQLDGSFGAAMVARLAILADIDLVARRVMTGTCVVRSPASSTEIVVTTRPGPSLRADVVIRSPQQHLRVVPSEGTKVETGSVIGPYRVVEQLGAGGMGQVFRVVHTTLGRSYALKVLRADAMSGDVEAPGRFVREARAAARIKHPHIVDVFDFGYLADGRPYLVMELLPGTSLAEEIEDGPIEARVAVTMARQLTSALAAAHAVGVVHADVSPSNVLVVDGMAKLVDFGLAQLRDDPSRLASDGPSEFVFGTPSYIAPEMIRGNPAEERSDQYSLGAVLYEMLTGRPPYKAGNIRDLCIKHLKAPIPTLDPELGPLPPELDRVIARCLAKSPAQRFSSMRELELALGDIEQGLSVGGWRQWLKP